MILFKSLKPKVSIVICPEKIFSFSEKKFKIFISPFSFEKPKSSFAFLILIEFKEPNKSNSPDTLNNESIFIPILAGLKFEI